MGTNRCPFHFIFSNDCNIFGNTYEDLKALHFYRFRQYGFYRNVPLQKPSEEFCASSRYILKSVVEVHLHFYLKTYTQVENTLPIK